MSDNYIYAVARIRALEMSLFSQATIEQLMALKTHKECLQFLVEHGWGDSDTDITDAEEILSKETEKAWSTIKEMVSDMSVFDVLLIPDLFHNLKAAIKTVVSGEVEANIFFDNASIGGKKMVEIIKNKDFKALPDYMQAAAEEGYESMTHTKDGQLLDLIIDRATLEAITLAASKAKDPLLKE